MKDTKIQWTDSTWNAVSGCDRQREKALRAYQKAIIGCEDIAKPQWEHIWLKRETYVHNITDPNGMDLVPGGWLSNQPKDCQADLLVAASNLVPHILADAEKAERLRIDLNLFHITAWQLKSAGILDKLRAIHCDTETLDSLDHLEEAADKHLHAALRESVEAAEQKRGGDR